MTRYRLVRHIETDYATYGRLYRPDGTLLCVTIERPWVDADSNGKRDRGVSRFIPGIYPCFLRLSHLHGGDGKRDYDVWQLEHVPDCDAAQIHIANFPTDLEGCVGLGERFESIEDRTHILKPGISGSASAFTRFMQDTKGQDAIELEVLEAFTATIAA